MRGFLNRFGRHIVLFVAGIVSIGVLAGAPVLAMAGKIDASDFLPKNATSEGHKLAHALKNAGKMPVVLSATTEVTPPGQPAPKPATANKTSFKNDQHHNEEDVDDGTPNVKKNPPHFDPPIQIDPPVIDPDPQPTPSPKPCGGCPGPTQFRKNIQCPMMDSTHFVCHFEFTKPV